MKNIYFYNWKFFVEQYVWNLNHYASIDMVFLYFVCLTCIFIHSKNILLIFDSIYNSIIQCLLIEELSSNAKFAQWRTVEHSENFIQYTELHNFELSVWLCLKWILDLFFFKKVIILFFIMLIDIVPLICSNIY